MAGSEGCVFLLRGGRVEKRGGEQERRGGLDDAKSIFFSALFLFYLFFCL